jgi:hypothetical protein
MYPHERSLVNKLNDRPFTILGINTEREREELKKVMEKEQITWRSWWEGGMGNGGPIAKQWNIHNWPTVYLIDHKGVIAGNALGYRNIDQRIEQLVLAAEGKPVDRNEEKSEAIAKITSNDLSTKVPNFFSFPYTSFPYTREPKPGKRYWLRIDNQHWVERYADGLEGKFKILCLARIHGNDGTIVVKIAGNLQQALGHNDGSFQAFIPDKGSKDMAILLRQVGPPDSNWVKLADMENVD